MAADKPIGTDGSIVRGIARFHDRPTIHRKLSDIRLEQCMYGFEVNSANPVAAPLVVDIEPIYREQVMSM